MASGGGQAEKVGRDIYTGDRVERDPAHVRSVGLCNDGTAKGIIQA